MKSLFFPVCLEGSHYARAPLEGEEECLLLEEGVAVEIIWDFWTGALSNLPIYFCIQLVIHMNE